MVRTTHERAQHHSRGWSVHRCDCGQVTLALGALRIDLTPEELGDLFRLLRAATEHFEIDGDSPTAPAPSTH